MTGHELRSLRLARGINRSALARALGVNYTTVYRWEIAAARISPVAELALRATIDRLSPAVSVPTP